MALTFGGASTDQVAVAGSASIDDLTAFSVLMWVYVTTDTTSRRLWSKGSIQVAFNSTNPADIFFDVDRATVNAGAVTATSVFTLNAWNILGFTYDESNGPQIYRGTLTSLLSEVAYQASPTVGSGATDSNTAALSVGNVATPSVPMQGDIARFQMFDARLTQTQLRRRQFYPFGDQNCVVHLELGFNGTGTQQDLSGNGNTGTVTGATVANHPPLVSPFPQFAEGASAFTAAASGGSGPDRAMPRGRYRGRNRGRAMHS